MSQQWKKVPPVSGGWRWSGVTLNLTTAEQWGIPTAPGTTPVGKQAGLPVAGCPNSHKGKGLSFCLRKGVSAFHGVWLDRAITVCKFSVLLSYPSPGPLARGQTWYTAFVWCFLVASFLSTQSQIEKEKENLKNCWILPWAPRSLQNPSSLHIPGTFHIYFIQNI